MDSRSALSCSQILSKKPVLFTQPSALILHRHDRPFTIYQMCILSFRLTPHLTFRLLSLLLKLDSAPLPTIVLRVDIQC